MKNLFTLLLLVISLLAFGQSNSQSLEVEIQYWKSIAESNDTVAYREYLQRYGEDGLYKDEAITRITLLKTSGKQTQSKNIECNFYKIRDDFYSHSVMRFDSGQNKVWFKSSDYDTIRSNLAVSSDFYENLNVTDKMQSWYDDKFKEWRRRYVGWNTNEEYEYDPMKSTSSRDVYFKRDELFLIGREYIVFNRPVTPYPSIYIYSDDVFWGINYGDKRIGDYFYSVEESKRHFYVQPYFKFNIIKIMQGYRYIAISKDKSSFIMWFEEDDNLDGKILEKREYKRVPKEDLLPKAVNYDFLNE